MKFPNNILPITVLEEDGGGSSVGENQTIKTMREELARRADAETAERQAKENALREKAELEARLQEIERSKLDETERLRLEKEDLAKKAAEADKLRDENGRFVARFEQMYNDKIAQVPEEHRERIKNLSSWGEWETRVNMIDEAMKLIPVREPVNTQPNMPTSSQPTVTPGGAAPAAFDPGNPWKGAFSRPGPAIQ